MTTDLSYVKEKLALVGHKGWHAVHKGSGVPARTIRRIAYGETKAPRSDNVGKLAIWFRTQEKRHR